MAVMAIRSVMDIHKTTIEIDSEKLEKLMSLAGFTTRKEAVDWALAEAIKVASINKIAETPWDAEFLKDAIDPDYDVIASRRKPVRYKGAK
jgi:Arc/MetJ family transcription regulator